MTITITRILRVFERKLDGPANYDLLGNQMQVQKIENMLEEDSSLRKKA